MVDLNATALAFAAGLTGSMGHCIGMCGPIVATFALGRAQPDGTKPRMLLSQTLYHSGRIATYTAIGLAMGLTGSILNTATSIAGIQKAANILAGLFMIVSGLIIAGAFKFHFTSKPGYFSRHANKAIALFGRGILIRSLGAGLVFGFIPCGLSANAFVAAAGSGSAAGGALITFAFGLGTLPGLMAFGMLIGKIGAHLRAWLYRVGGLVVIVTGLYYLWLGYRSNAGM